MTTNELRAEVDRTIAWIQAALENQNEAQAEADRCAQEVAYVTKELIRLQGELHWQINHPHKPAGAGGKE